MKRGRRSAADLSVIVDISRAPPPPPPGELSDEQATIWRDAAGAMPGNWLNRAAHPILVQYTRHITRARTLEKLIAQFRPEWLAAEGGLERLNKLLAAAERETKAIVACAR